MIKICIEAIGSDANEGPSDQGLEELVELLMALFGNPRTLPRAKANVVTEVNARLRKSLATCSWRSI